MAEYLCRPGSTTEVGLTIVDIEVGSLVNLRSFEPTLIKDSVRIALEHTLEDGKIGSEDADPGFMQSGSTLGKSFPFNYFVKLLSPA